MWTGTIVDLIHRTDPELWVVEIMVPDGRIFHDCTTEEIWNTLVIDQEYTMTNPCMED